VTHREVAKEVGRRGKDIINDNKLAITP